MAHRHPVITLYILCLSFLIWPFGLFNFQFVRSERWRLNNCECALCILFYRISHWSHLVDGCFRKHGQSAVDHCHHHYSFSIDFQVIDNYCLHAVADSARFCSSFCFFCFVLIITSVCIQCTESTLHIRLPSSPVYTSVCSSTPITLSHIRFCNWYLCSINNNKSPLSHRWHCLLR